LDHSYLWNGVPEADMGLPQGYQGKLDYRNMTQWNLSQGWAAGGVISTAEDMTSSSVRC